MRWLTVESDDGPITALAFRAGPRGQRIFRRLPLETVAAVIARACGHLGSNAAYLHNTVLHLAEAGVDCVVLEAAEIGTGGSGRNVGLVNAGMWMRPDDIVASVGEQVGGRLVSELGDGPAYVFELIGKHAIECEAVHNGTLHLAVGDAGVKEVEIRAAQWQRRGAPVEALSAAKAAASSRLDATTNQIPPTSSLASVNGPSMTEVLETTLPSRANRLPRFMRPRAMLSSYQT